MKIEDFEIRIRKDGTILVRTPKGMSESDLRLLREMLEDCLGSTVMQKDGDIPGSASIVNKDRIRIETGE